MIDTELEKHIAEAEFKALDSLARYKYMMFGYWAAIYLHLTSISGRRRPSPFNKLVKLAQSMRDKKES
jgi:hypothetical protein